MHISIKLTKTSESTEVLGWVSNNVTVEEESKP